MIKKKSRNVGRIMKNKKTLCRISAESFLIEYYYAHEEFSDEEGKFYNEEIEKFENGNLENVKELTLESLEERINKLELELKK